MEDMSKACRILFRKIERKGYNTKKEHIYFSLY
jgi:hypothetical protein